MNKVAADKKKLSLVVKAGVRYWEDATVNGVADQEGILIPFRKGDYWCPVIDLESGRIKDWPEGTRADVHYKVCDDGDYWLNDEDGAVWGHQAGYVPRFLAVGDCGYGDYIILEIGEDGGIVGWKSPDIDFREWPRPMP